MIDLYIHVYTYTKYFLHYFLSKSIVIHSALDMDRAEIYVIQFSINNLPVLKNAWTAQNIMLMSDSIFIRRISYFFYFTYFLKVANL